MSALLCTSLLGVELLIGKATAQTPPPYVVFVNGQGNCCAWNMRDLQNRLANQMNAEIREIPYSNFRNGGRSGGGNEYDWSSVDTQFLKDGADFINKFDRNRPLILIGHSYGGDSVLKLLPRINRRVQFVGVIDPVRTGGFRASLKALTVPSNVDYFFNRWQNNEPFPNDYPVNGSISCNAKRCDQDSQFAHTDTNGKPRREKCGFLETCRTKQVRTGHQTLPTDDYIQKIIGDKIQQQVAAFQPRLESELIAQIQGVHNQVIGGDGGPLYVNAGKDILKKGTLQDLRNFLVDNFSESSIQRVHNESIGGNGGPLYVNAGKAILRRDGASLEDVRNFLRRDFGGK